MFKDYGQTSLLSESDNSTSEMDSPKVTQFNPELQKAHSKCRVSLIPSLKTDTLLL